MWILLSAGKIGDRMARVNLKGITNSMNLKELSELRYLFKRRWNMPCPVAGQGFRKDRD
jgi:hypothetical protein